MVGESSPVPPLFRDRISALEASVRAINLAELDALTHEVEQGMRVNARAAGFKPFWRAGTRGVKPTQPETAALELLWTRINVGLAEGLTGRDLATEDAGRELIARIDRLLQPRRDRRLEGLAAAIIERSSSASNPWAGFVAIWNACCAVLLRERLTPEIRSELLSTWLGVFDREPGMSPPSG